MPRTALITGCSSPQGIGANVALALVGKGYRVIATARRLSSLDHLIGKCELIELDVTDEDSRLRAVEEVKRLTGGRLNVLVNNAGVDAHAPSLDTSLPAFRSILETNLIAPLAMIQTFAPLLIKGANESDPLNQDKNAKLRTSVILNTGSIAIWGMGWSGAYNASKAGLQVLSDTLRIEMENLNVKVITCETGAVQTGMYAHTYPFPNITTPQSTSGYYSNYSHIAEKLIGDFESRRKSTCTVQAAAKVIADAIDKHDSKIPSKIHPGSYSWMLSWVMPLLEKMNMKDRLWKSSTFTDMVQEPRFKSHDE